MFAGSKSLLCRRFREPCPTQLKQEVTITTIEVGKEGLEALTVWINVWFPDRWNAAPRLAFHVNSDTLPPKHKDPREPEVHDHDQNITGKDINPFSQGLAKPSCIMAALGKTECPEKKLPHAHKMMQILNPVRDCAPQGNSHYPNQLNWTTLRVNWSQRLASPPNKEWFRDAHRGPPAKPSY